MEHTINYSNEEVIQELIICGYEAAIIFKQNNLIELFITRNFLETMALMQQEHEIIEMSFEEYEQFLSIYTYNGDGVEQRNNLPLNSRQINQLQQSLVEALTFEEIQPIIDRFFASTNVRYAYLAIDINFNIRQNPDEITLQPGNQQFCIPEIIQEN